MLLSCSGEGLLGETVEVSVKLVAVNRTGKTRWTAVQVGPRFVVVGHYLTRAAADAGRAKWIERMTRGVSGVGPIVQVIELQPGEGIEN